VGFGKGDMQNGETGSGKPLPVGMQLIGNYLQEARLLNVAHQYQLNTVFHNAKPEGI
jgi:aspartyl-tRNA(Asn)/glutamyl-tRNA(Gln) amidotransferase subunit A